MATQYTPILQLALPVTGELNGTWGDVVNDNITSMVEEAIAGLATISTWTANSHTLTTVDGLTDEARCAMIVAQTGAGGTALTAAGEIICPARTKLYVVSNQSAYQVTIKTAAGTGIAVAAGDTTFVFCDGTNVLACVTQITNGHITGNLTVDGNTTLGNATSDTITATARFASDVNPSADNTYDLGTAGNSWRNLYIDGTGTIATIVGTNLQITNLKANDGTAAGSIANSTGVVTLNSAVLTTADINGGTIDATSIGATTPSTGVFTQVDITAQGDLRLQDASGGQYVAMQAPATVPASYTLTWPDTDGDAGQALVTDGSGVLSWSTAASGDVYGPASATDNAVSRFDGTTGKLIQNSVVTIGDTGDVAGVGALSMSGAITLSGGSANGVAYLNASKVLTTGSALTFDGTNFSTTGAVTAASYSRVTNGTIDMRMELAPGLGYVGTVSNHPVAFEVNSTEQMRLTSTGLGIGTTTMTGKLNVTGGGVTALFLSGASGSLNSISLGRTSIETTYGIVASSGQFFTNSAAGDSVIAFGSGNLLIGSGDYDTSGTERMRLDSSGNLGLGVTPSAWTSGYRALDIGSYGTIVTENTTGKQLDLWYNSYFNGAAYYKNNGYASVFRQSSSGQFQWYLAPSGTAGTAASFTQAMTLDASGNLGIGVTNPDRVLTIAASSNSNAISVRGRASDNLSAIIFDQNTGNAASYPFITGVGSASGPLSFGTASSERMRIDSSGNVGIGTSSPSSFLADANKLVVGTGSGSNGLSIYSGASNKGRIAFADGTTGGDPYAGLIDYDHSVNAMLFSTNGGSERMRLDSSGNLGLGVTPSAWSLPAFESTYGLIGGVGEINITQNAYYNAGWKYKATAVSAKYSQISGNHAWYTAPSGTAGNAISYTQAMTLDASGNMIVGGTSTNYRMEVVGPSGDNIISCFRSGDATAANNAGGGFRSISSATATSRVAQVWLDADGANLSGGDYFFIQKNGNSGTVVFNQHSNAAMTFLTNNTERMRIDSSGNLLVGTTTAYASAENVKLNVSGAIAYGTGDQTGATAGGGGGAVTCSYYQTAGTTKTVKVDFTGGGGSFAVTVTVGTNIYGGQGHGRAMWMVGGDIVNNNYGVTELVRVNSGSSTISAITTTTNYFTFTVANAGSLVGTIGVSVQWGGYNAGLAPIVTIS